jgi:predicted Zn-dependent protease
VKSKSILTLLAAALGASLAGPAAAAEVQPASLPQKQSATAQQSTIADRPPPPAMFNLPTLGDASREDLSPALERKVGEEIMRDMRGDKDYLDDAPLLEYLNNFGNTLVSARPEVRGETSFDFFFFCVRDPQLNAFALPGGFIAVHSALLLAAETESELASVLSHEIGHVAQRHIARMIGQQREDVLIPLASMILAALASRAGGDVAMGVFAAGQGLAMQRQLNFGRDAEREADRIGFQIMGEAGYDTSGMVNFFSKMQAATRSYSDLTPAWLLTHPLTTERIADIQARIREQPYKQRADSLDFHLVRARARVLQDESVQGLAAATAAFQSQLTLPSRQQAAAAQYGLSFIALRKGDLPAAQRWLDAARSTVSKPPAPGTFSAAPPAAAPSSIFTAMALDIKLANKQDPAMAQQALKEAEAAHVQFPLSRGIARQYAQAMVGAGQLEQAAHYLRDQVQLYREEPKLYELLAETYAAQGKRALQHIALAESYALSGGMMAALDQLSIARKSTDATFYDMSVIDARERELQQRRREQMKEKG